MGLRRWLQARRKPDPKRPWVRPQFLVAFVFLTALTGVIAYWAAKYSGIDAGSPGPGTVERTEYVGLSPQEILDPTECQAPCTIAERLDVWRAAHPQAQILEQTPMYYRGVLAGYTIRYSEAG